MNYGAIGFVIGHEITHGFDDQGRKYDKQGNLVDWWARKTKKRFLEKVLCIIKQYGNYTVDEVGLKVCCVQFWSIMVTLFPEMRFAVEFIARLKFHISRISNNYYLQYIFAIVMIVRSRQPINNRIFMHFHNYESW